MLVVPVSEDLLQSGVQSEHQLLQLLSLDLCFVVGRQYEWDSHFSIVAGALRFSDLEYSAALFSSRHCNRTNVSGSSTTTFWNFSLDSVLRYSLFPAGTESPLNRKYRRFKSQRGSQTWIFPSSTQKVFSWPHTCLRASTAHARCSSPRLRRSLSSSLIVRRENARGQRRTQRANQLTKIVIRGFTTIEQMNKYAIDCACD